VQKSALKSLDLHETGAESCPALLRLAAAVSNDGASWELGGARDEEGHAASANGEARTEGCHGHFQRHKVSDAHITSLTLLIHHPPRALPLPPTR
jgi:hypothetical protein